MPNLKQICKIVKGTLKGDPELEIASVNSLYQAGIKEITFAATDHINLDLIKASALIVSKESRVEFPNLIFVQNPFLAFASLLEHFFPHQSFNHEIDSHARIAKSAKIAADVTVGAFSYIGKNTKIASQTEIHAGVKIYDHVTIGKNCLIYSNVVIGQHVQIGDHVIIHSGAVIGADGFGFQKNQDGIPVKIPQKGKIKIGNHCEIGANACIDRATIGTTELKDHVKLDNLVQIAHNVVIGANTTISALSGISGSVEIGENVTMGGQVGIADHVKITNGVMIASKTGITGHIKKRGVIAGAPHMPFPAWKKNHVIFRNLYKYLEKIKILEKKIKKLEGK